MHRTHFIFHYKTTAGNEDQSSVIYYLTSISHFNNTATSQYVNVLRYMHWQIQQPVVHQITNLGISYYTCSWII